MLAWFWDYCSNERLDAVKKLHKNPREIIINFSPNHNMISSIKALPWPLSDRQFVSENTWTKQDDDTYFFAWRSPTTSRFDDNRLVDVGKHKANKLVRAESKGFCTLTNVGNQKCELTWVSHFDAKGNLPAKVMENIIPRSLGLVTQLRERFNRDNEIDQEERNELMGVMKNSEDEVYSEEENEMVKRIIEKIENIKEDLFKPLNSPDFRTKVSVLFVHFFPRFFNELTKYFARLAQMSVAHIEGESDTYMKCEVKVDASVVECAAYCFALMSRKRSSRSNNRKNVLLRETKSHNRHSQDNVQVRDFGFGTQPRQFLTRHVWKRLGGERIVYVNESIEHSNLFPSAASKNNNFVRAGVTGFFYFESITEHSTKLKYVTQVNLGGNILHQVVDHSAVGFLRDYITMRQLFSKDYEIDLERRRGLLTGKLKNVDEHSKVESDEIERGKLLFSQFRNSEQSKVTVKTDNKLVSAVAVEFGGKAWCRLSTTVRCGGEEALAFLLSVDSRSLMSEHDLKLSEVIGDERRLDKNDKENNDNGHTQVVSMLESKVLGDGMKVQNSMNRRMAWKEIDGNFSLYSSPIGMTSFELRKKEIPTVQDKSVLATKITQVSETKCKVS